MTVCPSWNLIFGLILLFLTYTRSLHTNREMCCFESRKMDIIAYGSEDIIFCPKDPIQSSQLVRSEIHWMESIRPSLKTSLSNPPRASEVKQACEGKRLLRFVIHKVGFLKNILLGSYYIKAGSPSKAMLMKSSRDTLADITLSISKSGLCPRN